MNHQSFIRIAFFVLTGGLPCMALGQPWPTIPELWAEYDPDQGDYKEEIVAEQTRDGLYYRESYISAYILGEEVRVYCKYLVKPGIQHAPGLLQVHGWMGAPHCSEHYAQDGGPFWHTITVVRTAIGNTAPSTLRNSSTAAWCMAGT